MTSFDGRKGDLPINSPKMILLMLGLLAVVVPITRGVFFLVHKKVYRHSDNYTQEMFVAVEASFWVICESALFFAIFDWRFALPLWALSFFGNAYVMTHRRIYTALFAPMHRRILKKLSEVKKSPRYEYTHERPVVSRPAGEDLTAEYRPRLGWTMRNRSHEYKWYVVQLCCLMFVLPPFAFAMAVPGLGYPVPLQGCSALLYQLLLLGGVLGVVYALMYCFTCDGALEWPVRSFKIFYLIVSAFIVLLAGAVLIFGIHHAAG